MDCRGALNGSLGVPHGISGAEELFAAVEGAQKEHWRQWKARYSNFSLFAFTGDRLGNRWLWPGAGHMGDGDKIKSLRLHTNLFLTRTLSNKHAADPRARLCRRCGQKKETASHILQECTFVQAPRCSRHNYIEAQIIAKLRECHPSAIVSSERLITDRDGVTPDIVLDLPERVYVLDVAVAWDANTGSLEHVNAGKRTKYTSLNPVLGPKPVTVLGLTFGARGLVCAGTRRLPRKLV
ncbi:hypothetical protein HPB48_009925 [Haemaphysalis longicornis]|uniref:Reverse transcriptase n=1 Tax=Haemaphysalis longicornis TaxID=44386 RepID=A0A9J6GUA0_HAELO|nr:hypothetical protein HPB48_009925 [Haemaphysalis longicornis]